MIINGNLQKFKKFGQAYLYIQMRGYIPTTCPIVHSDKCPNGSFGSMTLMILMFKAITLVIGIFSGS